MNLKRIRIQRFWERGQTEIHDAAPSLAAAPERENAPEHENARDIIESWLIGAGFGDVMTYDERTERYYVGSAWFAVEKFDTPSGERWVIYLSRHDVYRHLTNLDEVQQASVIWHITACVTRNNSRKQLEAMGYFYGGR